MSSLPYLEQVQADTFGLLEILRRAPHQAVPSCPGWDVARLAGHVGRVHRMSAYVVHHNLAQPPGKDEIDPAPTDAHAIEEYLLRGLAKVLETLRAAAPEAPAWNMTGQHLTAGFWPRRMAHETAIHRVDAELATGPTVTPIPPALAIDGVDEFFDLVPSRVLPKHPDAHLGGTLHLHATDGPGEWMIAVRNGTLQVEHGHGKGDAAIRGHASDLMLGVWSRCSWADDRFERFGNPDVVAAFESLGAF